MSSREKKCVDPFGRSQGDEKEVRNTVCTTAGASVLPLPHKGAVGHFKGYFKC